MTRIYKRAVSLVLCLILALGAFAFVPQTVEIPVAAAVSISVVDGSVLVLDSANKTLANVIENTTVSTLLGHLSAGTKIYSADGVLRGNSEIVCTGDYARLYVGSVLNDELAIAVRGDVNGDGFVASVDYVLIKLYFKGKSLTSAQLLAADADASGAIETYDYIRVRNEFVASTPVYKDLFSSLYPVIEPVYKYNSAADAAAAVNATGTVEVGNYYMHPDYVLGLDGMFCLSATTDGADSFWIDASKNVDTPSGGEVVTLYRPINKYDSESDALHQINMTGETVEGTSYYVYNGYPTGVNGMYNLTSDPTGNTPGFWANLSENKAGPLNYKTVKAIWLSQFDLNNVYVQSYYKQRDVSTFTTYITRTLQDIKEMGFNTVIVQVRPYGDSMYPSEYFPPSSYVVASYGKSFSYDPFEIIVAQARKLALSVHAWLNPLRLMTASEIASVSSDYPIKSWYNSSQFNGKFVVNVNSRLYLNPAYEDVRNLIVNGITEVATNYDIDGVHFDDYFYPTTSSSFDSAAYADSGKVLSLANFRRDNVNKLVKQAYNAVKAVDSEMLFGISPAGDIDHNMYTLYADVKTWCQNTGYIDYITPQIYWGFENSYSPFDEVLPKWNSLVTANGVDLIVGLQIYKAAGDNLTTEDGNEWSNNTDILARSVNFTFSSSKANGICLYGLNSTYNPTSGSFLSSTASERANMLAALKEKYVE